jgi:hypothetical protein
MPGAQPLVGVDLRTTTGRLVRLVGAGVLCGVPACKIPPLSKDAGLCRLEPWSGVIAGNGSASYGAERLTKGQIIGEVHSDATCNTVSLQGPPLAPKTHGVDG